MSNPPAKSPGKRVRFAEQVEEVHSKRSRPEEFARDVESLESSVSAVTLAAPSSSSSPPAPTSSRCCAARRAELLRVFDEDNSAMDASQDVDWDFEQAAEHDDPEELYNDAGIPLEPFNMRQEREEGFFDAVTGDYVAYKRRNREERDAWVDALPVTKRDEDFSWMVEGKRAFPRNDADVAEEAHVRDVAALKSQVVSLLRPGEDVLAALRRLGKPRATPEQRDSPLTGAAAAGASSLLSIPGKKQGGASSVSTTLGRTMHRTESLQRARIPLPPENKSDFDSLTSASMHLFQSGVHEIHSMPRERIIANMQEYHSPAARIVRDQGEGNKGRQQEIHGGAGPSQLKRAPVVSEGSSQKYVASTQGLTGNECDPAHTVDQCIIADAHASTSPICNTSIQTARRPVDTDMDMFADDIDLDPRNRGPDATGEGLNNETEGNSVLDAGQQPGRKHRAPATHRSEDLPAGAPDLMGFEQDETSGYLFNASLRCYYDPQTRLFGDAATGVWYAVDAASGEFRAR